MRFDITATNPETDQQIVDDFCLARKYDPASGVTKNQFFKREIIKLVRQIVKQGEAMRTTDPDIT